MEKLTVVLFFNTGCYYLPKLLDRASHSPELIAVIQSGKFQNTYGKGVFPPKLSTVSHHYDQDKIDRVVEAFEAYLRVGEFCSVCLNNQIDLAQRVAPPVPTTRKWVTWMSTWGIG